MLDYCKTCILPSSRPNLEIDAKGNCNCVLADRAKIDWKARELEFEQLKDWVQTRKKGPYDVVIPVSGGKDSTWQAVTARKHGLNCLLVTWKTPFRTSLGEHNLTNLVSLGFDHFDVKLDLKIEKKLMKAAFVERGSPAIPMHMAIHSIPVRVADALNIPLVLWGEDSASQYGGEASDRQKPYLNNQWQRKYSATSGTDSDFWRMKGFTEEELFWYTTPALNSNQIKQAFLGYFFRWDAQNSAEVARTYGFQAAAAPVVGINRESDLDDDVIMPIHHWMKWPKFGFTRTWDNLSHEIREGRIGRDEAIRIIEESDTIPPSDAIRAFCDFVNLTTDDFWRVVESHRNKDIWKKNKDGHWEIMNFLVRNWNWNES